MISCYHLIVRHPSAERPLLDDISIDIARGEFVEIIGPSGAGKSVLCSIFGLRRRVRGAKCIVVGRNIDRLAAAQITEVRQRIGSRAQSPEFLEGRSLLENLLLPLVARNREDGRALEVVQTLLAGSALEGLSQVPMRGLSHGQRALAGILRALVGEPELVIIDGGLEGLGELEEEAIAALRQVSRAGATVLLAARELSPCARLRSQVIRLEAGRLCSTQRSEAPAPDVAAVSGRVEVI